VSQNLLLPYEPVSAMGRLRSREAARRAEAILLRLGLDGIAAEAEVGDLDLPARQKLEIARAASYEPAEDPASRRADFRVVGTGPRVALRADAPALPIGNNDPFHLAPHAGGPRNLRFPDRPAQRP
jgi:hypothetical protein